MHNLVISSGSAEIIVSGLATSFKGSPISVSFGEPARITLTFSFVDQAGEGHSMKSNSPAPNTLEFTLVNFSNPLGTGTTQPIQIGTFGGKPMYVHFRVYSIGESDRTLQFTVYADSSSGESGNG